MQDQEPIKFETHISLLQLQQPSIFSFLFALLSRFNKRRVNGKKLWIFLTLAARFTVMTAKWPYLLDQDWLWVEMLWLTKNHANSFTPKSSGLLWFRRTFNYRQEKNFTINSELLIRDAECI